MTLGAITSSEIASGRLDSPSPKPYAIVVPCPTVTRSTVTKLDCNQIARILAAPTLYIRSELVNGCWDRVSCSERHVLMRLGEWDLIASVSG